MKHKILLWLMLLFFPLALGTSCNTEVNFEKIKYEGKILSLIKSNNNEHYNIILITRSTSKKGVPVGSSIGFYDRDFGERMNEGDIVHFRVPMFQEWVGPETADHLWPQYVGVIKFYEN